jgi:TrmH family RNA methyltransferase
MITSSHNPKIQRVRSLISRRQERETQGEFVVEGVRLNEEAQNAGWSPSLLLYSSQLSERGRQIVDKYPIEVVDVEEVSPQIMSAIADTETPQGILGIFPIEELAPPDNLDFVLIVDVLRDPGNLGTIFRTAAAAGVQAVILTPGSADAYSPKVVRAGMGAHFHLPILSLDWTDTRDLCRVLCEPPLTIILADPAAEQAYWQVDLRRPLALVIGGEAEGASPEAQQIADCQITIPMPGKSESLNAAVAASIILFEVVRQRSL